jgi:3-oxoacyl-[acyl-carrier protein] reductase
MVKIREDGTVIKLSEEEFERVIDINLKGVFLCAEAVAEVMIRQKSGVIINASSIVGLDGNFGQTNYVASKAGVVGMTKVWARELGKYGIRVNAVAPGYILTDMLAQVPADVLDKMATKVPLRRLGKPDDIANVYAFLASDEAAYISGDVIRVDGGAVAGT